MQETIDTKQNQFSRIVLRNANEYDLLDAQMRYKGKTIALPDKKGQHFRCLEVRLDQLRRLIMDLERVEVAR